MSDRLSSPYDDLLIFDYGDDAEAPRGDNLGGGDIILFDLVGASVSEAVDAVVVDEPVAEADEGILIQGDNGMIDII